MSRIWRLLHHRTVWTAGVALLAVAAVSPLLLLVLKVLGLAPAASLHSWLFDAGQVAGNAGPKGAAGAAASAGAKGSKSKNPYTSPDDGRTHPGNYTPTPSWKGNPADDPAFKQAQSQAAHDLHQNDPVPTPRLPNLASDVYHGLQNHLQGK